MKLTTQTSIWKWQSLLNKLAQVIFAFIVFNHNVYANDIRIASVDSNATEILKALGYEENIVAADITSQPLLANHEQQNLGYHRTLSPEGLLTVRPTLVVGSDHMGPEKVLMTLKQADIELIKLTSPHNVNDLMANIKKLGARWDAQTEVTRLISHVQQQHQKIQHLLPQQHTMVFLFDMGDRGISMAGKETAGGALISLLNGQNISEYSSYKPISMETLLSLNPDIIMIGQQSDTIPDINAILTQYPLLTHSNAAKHQQIIPVNAATLIAGISLGALDEATRIATTLTNISD